MKNNLDNYEFIDLKPKSTDVLKEVLEGLQQDPKIISPKFFYDERGSHFFNQITELKEYYITRSEIEILKNQQKELSKRLPAEAVIIEYGCGSSRKVELLLECLSEPQAYVALDISQAHLLEMIKGLAQDFPHLEHIALCTDYSQDFSLPKSVKELNGPRLIFFPGSSIGNFEPDQAVELLKHMAQSAGEKGHLLIGVDLKKDTHILEAAYDDSQGVTAKFNLNLLKRLNRECESNFDLEKFKHLAFYNQEKGRVEMHLQSLEDQKVKIKESETLFEKDETIHTENSYKYTVQEFEALAKKAGWNLKEVWKDKKKYFSLQHYQL